MKRFLVFILFALIAIPASTFAQNNEARGTANYLLANPERYLDKPTTIYVLMASPVPAQAPEGYVAFAAYTSGNNGKLEGGSILLYVKERNADKFKKKYSQGWVVNGKPVVYNIQGRFIKSVDEKGYAVRVN
jgi:hypothetical protein